MLRWVRNFLIYLALILVFFETCHRVFLVFSAFDVKYLSLVLRRNYKSYCLLLILRNAEVNTHRLHLWM